MAAADAGARLPEGVVAKARAVIEVHAESVRAAISAGVEVAMGTDSGVGPHGRNLDELPLMQDCGMTAAQTLASATSNAARLCDLQDVTGRVASGLVADLVVVAGDACELRGLRERIRQVWQGGRLVVGT